MDKTSKLMKVLVPTFTCRGSVDADDIWRRKKTCRTFYSLFSVSTNGWHCTIWHSLSKSLSVACCSTSHCRNFTPLSGGMRGYCGVREAFRLPQHLPPEWRGNKRVTCEKFDGSLIAALLLTIHDCPRNASPVALTANCLFGSNHWPCCQIRCICAFDGEFLRNYFLFFVGFLTWQLSRDHSLAFLFLAYSVSCFDGAVSRHRSSIDQ